MHSTYGYDKSEISKANELLKTGQVPMDVNAMPGLVDDKSEAENLQGREVCYSARNLDITSETVDSWMNGKGRTQTGRPEVTLVMLRPVTLYPVTTAGKRVTSLGSAGERGETTTLC